MLDDRFYFTYYSLQAMNILNEFKWRKMINPNETLLHVQIFSINSHEHSKQKDKGYNDTNNNKDNKSIPRELESFGKPKYVLSFIFFLLLPFTFGIGIIVSFLSSDNINYSFGCQVGTGVLCSLLFIFLVLKLNNVTDRYLVRKQILTIVFIILPLLIIARLIGIIINNSIEISLELSVIIGSFAVQSYCCLILYFISYWLIIQDRLIIKQRQSRELALSRNTSSSSVLANKNKKTASNKDIIDNYNNNKHNSKLKEISILNIMNNKGGFGFFANFLLSEYSIENLLFIIEWTQYKAKLRQYLYKRGCIKGKREKKQDSLLLENNNSSNIKNKILKRISSQNIKDVKNINIKDRKIETKNMKDSSDIDVSIDLPKMIAKNTDSNHNVNVNKRESNTLDSHVIMNPKGKDLIRIHSHTRTSNENSIDEGYDEITTATDNDTSAHSSPYGSPKSSPLSKPELMRQLSDQRTMYTLSLQPRRSRVNLNMTRLGGINDNYKNDKNDKNERNDDNELNVDFDFDFGSVDWTFKERSPFKENIFEIKWMPLNEIFINVNELTPYDLAKYLFDKLSSRRHVSPIYYDLLYFCEHSPLRFAIVFACCCCCCCFICWV